MPSLVQTAAFDAETNATAPTKPLGTGKTILLQSTPAHNGFYFFALSAIPARATIVSAVFKLYQKGVAAGGSRTLAGQRAATQWTESKLVATGQPAGVGSTAGCTFSTAGVDGREWALDVQPLIQEVANGGVWWGLKVTSNNATALAFYSKDNTKFRPVLEVTWTVGPDKPSNISPRNGRAISIARPTIRFGSATGAGQIGSYRLELNTSDSWGSPAYDTTQVFSGTPEHTLTSDVALNVLQYGRVMVWDANGVASAWSDTFTFIRRAQSAAAITLPAASPNNFVNDATPPLAGTSAGTVTKFQFLIVNPADPSQIYHDSGVITSSTLAYTPPEGVLTSLTTNYRLYMRVWDNIDRETIANDTAYVEVFRDFTFVLSNTVDPVTNLNVSTQEPSHLATATWDSATAPDYFRAMIDGQMSGPAILPGDVFLGGTSYRLVMANLRPRRGQAVSIVRVVNGVASALNPVKAVDTAPEGIWLSAKDGSNPVCISNGEDIGSWDTTEISEIVQGVGADFPALLTQTLGARTSTHSGWLKKQHDIPDVEPEDWETRLKALADPPGQLVRLALTNTNLAGCIYKLIPHPADENGDIEVEFEFVEQSGDV